MKTVYEQMEVTRRTFNIVILLRWLGFYGEL